MKRFSSTPVERGLALWVWLHTGLTLDSLGLSFQRTKRIARQCIQIGIVQETLGNHQIAHTGLRALVREQPICARPKNQTATPSRKISASCSLAHAQANGSTILTTACEIIKAVRVPLTRTAGFRPIFGCAAIPSAAVWRAGRGSKRTQLCQIL